MLEVFNQGHGSDSWGEGEVVTHTQRLNEIAGRVERAKNNPLGLTYEYQDITWLLEEVRVLREELKVVTDALEFEVNEGGGCDHETGICWCPVLKKIRHAKSALERNEDNE